MVELWQSRFLFFFFELLGFMNKLRNQQWDVLMLGMEWSTGAEEARWRETFRFCSGGPLQRASGRATKVAWLKSRSKEFKNDF